MDRRALLIGALATVGWAGAPRAQPADSQAGLEVLEPIYGVSATPAGVTIRVASKGCAAKADFAFYVDRKAGGAPSVAFGRKRVELCKPSAAPGGHADLSFSYGELGVDPGAPLTVLNPIAAPPAHPLARPLKRPARAVAKHRSRKRRPAQ